MKEQPPKVTARTTSDASLTTNQLAEVNVTTAPTASTKPSTVATRSFSVLDETCQNLDSILRWFALPTIQHVPGANIPATAAPSTSERERRHKMSSSDLTAALDRLSSVVHVSAKDPTADRQARQGNVNAALKDVLERHSHTDSSLFPPLIRDAGGMGRSTICHLPRASLALNDDIISFLDAEVSLLKNSESVGGSVSSAVVGTPQGISSAAQSLLDKIQAVGKMHSPAARVELDTATTGTGQQRKNQAVSSAKPSVGVPRSMSRSSTDEIALKHGRKIEQPPPEAKLHRAPDKMHASNKPSLSAAVTSHGDISQPSEPGKITRQAGRQSLSSVAGSTVREGQPAGWRPKPVKRRFDDEGSYDHLLPGDTDDVLADHPSTHTTAGTPATHVPHAGQRAPAASSSAVLANRNQPRSVLPHAPSAKAKSSGSAGLSRHETSASMCQGVQPSTNPLSTLGNLAAVVSRSGHDMSGKAVSERTATSQTGPDCHETGPGNSMARHGSSGIVSARDRSSSGLFSKPGKSTCSSDQVSSTARSTRGVDGGMGAAKAVVTQPPATQHAVKSATPVAVFTMETDFDDDNDLDEELLLNAVDHACEEKNMADDMAKAPITSHATFSHSTQSTVGGRSSAPLGLVSGESPGHLSSVQDYSLPSKPSADPGHFGSRLPSSATRLRNTGQLRSKTASASPGVGVVRSQSPVLPQPGGRTANTGTMERRSAVHNPASGTPGMRRFQASSSVPTSVQSSSSTSSNQSQLQHRKPTSAPFQNRASTNAASAPYARKPVERVAVPSTGHVKPGVSSSLRPLSQATHVSGWQTTRTVQQKQPQQTLSATSRGAAPTPAQSSKVNKSQLIAECPMCGQAFETW